MYSPTMASLIAKRKKNKLYYYVVDSARVQGRPRIVHQTYLGSAEKVAALLKERTAPLPLSASRRELGPPGALWLAAQQSGVFALLQSLWEPPRSGPSPAHYLLLAAMHRICSPGPKTTVAEWYQQTILSPLWGFAPERFSSQAFWDCFEQLLPEKQAEEQSEERDPLEEAQVRLLGLWKEKQLLSRRLLAYDTTNLHTFIATTNTRNTVAQRGHNKQGRHNLRQVGLSYVLDGESGLSLCHHVYPGNVADAEEFPVALERIQRLLARHAIPPETVTLVFDKGAAALANTVLLQEAGLGWISALPWNQAPAEFRQRPVEGLPACSSAQPGVQAAAEKLLVHGEEYLCVLKYSATFAAEQLHSLSASLSKVLGALKRLAVEMARPGNRLTPVGIEAKIHRWLAAPFLSGLVHYQILDEPGGRTPAVSGRSRRAPETGDASPGPHAADHQPPSIGPPSRSSRPTPANKRSSKFFGASRKATGPTGNPCITGPTARSACMLSTACWVSPCCTTFAAKPNPSGPPSPSKNCRNS